MYSYGSVRGYVEGDHDTPGTLQYHHISVRGYIEGNHDNQGNPTP